MDYVAQLKDLPKKHDFFIGFDSDGCVFDTMEIKHKECFCPAFIKHFKLQAASKYAREVWDFVNLYSKDRGSNRFIAVQKAFALMRNRKVFKDRGIHIPEMKSLDAWLKEETKLGNPTLEAKVKSSPDKDLEILLGWTKEVNKRIEDMVYGCPPFPGVKTVMDKAKSKADMIVVSQTPLEALQREWVENKLDKYLSCMAGQEHGTKTEHLKFATDGKGYSTNKILMVGDALGDLKAAEGSNALFFPIIPGNEEASWKQFAEEGIDKFFNGTFAGGYQKKLLAALDKALPATPPWKD
ncbi:MAG TPA: haloacid dehalogenase [Lentisphaeria bacterium]|nr:MAG: haloacid dehalogenase [Lentisphaerae bacterium GWF2_49_21]HBC89359.1 haloacid dehalogenase [Lentisphaeria bacterium]